MYVPPHKRGASTTPKTSGLTTATNAIVTAESQSTSFEVAKKAEMKEASSKVMEQAKFEGSGEQAKNAEMIGDTKKEEFTEDTVFFAKFPTPPPRECKLINTNA